MSGQPAVLQVVILRDGLLVGTEVFVPGQYSVGSGDAADLRLDDGLVQPAHAQLYFQNGRAAIQDAGGGVFVNGHRVTACEVRSVDEISIGPFSLKMRVMSQKPAANKAAPSAEVSALLGQPKPAAPAPARPVAAAPAAPQPPAAAKPGMPATVVSARRMNVAPQAAAPAEKPAHLRPVTPLPIEDAEERTEAVRMPAEPIPQTTMPMRAPVQHELVQQTMPLQALKPPPPPPVTAPPVARAAPAAAPEPAPTTTLPETEAIPTRQVPRVEINAAPAPKASVPRRATGSTPKANDGVGVPNLFIEVYWGETRRVARSFKTIPAKNKVLAHEDDAALVPLYGFGLDGKPFTLADQVGPGAFRVFVPPRAVVERKATDGNFYPVQPTDLEKAPSGSYVTLGDGHALRFSSDGEMTMVAYVQPAIPKPFVNPLKQVPWLVVALAAIGLTSVIGFKIFYVGSTPEPDFQGKKLNPVAVRLIAPPKPEEKKKIEEKIKEVKKVAKIEDKPTKIEKALPKQVAQETKKALKSVEKLMAAGPAMKDLLAAVDKLGSGPGVKNMKNDMKLSGMLGKMPVAAAGIGAFGLGGGGAGGMGIKGAELLRGKGGAGIGALGAGNIGKGAVGGAVNHAVARSVQAQGSIDKDAVAKVINSHLHEVSSCYERALLKQAGLSGKIVLEWNISTSGQVTTAKTKSSTMKSSEVEQCILTALKGWQFPPAQGAGVIISYPFMFNSVGF